MKWRASNVRGGMRQFLWSSGVSGRGFQLVLTEEDGVVAATYIVKKVLDSWCRFDVIFVELQVSVTPIQAPQPGGFCVIQPCDREPDDFVLSGKGWTNFNDCGMTRSDIGLDFELSP